MNKSTFRILKVNKEVLLAKKSLQSLTAYELIFTFKYCRTHVRLRILLKPIVMFFEKYNIVWEINLFLSYNLILFNAQSFKILYAFGILYVYGKWHFASDTLLNFLFMSGLCSARMLM